jgi:small basic protein
MHDRPRTVLVNLWLPFAFLIVGLLVGLQFSFTVPQEFARYTAVGILAAFDAVLGAVRAELNGTYDNRVFVSGFVANVLLAAGLTYLGDRLGVDLSLAAVVAFGVRLFSNLALIRRRLLG